MKESELGKKYHDGEIICREGDEGMSNRIRDLTRELSTYKKDEDLIWQDTKFITVLLRAVIHRLLMLEM